MALNSDSRETVILVHGIWMKGLELRYLGYMLKRAGYAVRYYRYASLFGTPEKNIAGLVQLIEAENAPKLHLVAHSLGGLVTMQALRQTVGAGVGKVVLIGAPARGSRVAHRLQRLHAGWLAGRSQPLLMTAAPAWDLPIPLATIAGDFSLGVGTITGGLEKPSDGTVAVSETRIDGATDHCVVHASHFSMLMAPRVVRLVLEFLQQGRFMHCSQR